MTRVIISFTLISLLLFQNVLLSLSARRSSAGSNKRRKNINKKRFDSDDYYAVLGLRKTAKEKEIKSNYRKLALKYHPDKVKDGDDPEENEHIFVKISQAYAVLNDKEKKKVYDQYGINGLHAFEKGHDPASAGFGGGFGGGRSSSSSSSSSNSHGGQGFREGFSGQNFNFNFGGSGSERQGFAGGGSNGGFDPFSMFENMFGSRKKTRGGRGGGNQQQHQKQQQQRPELFPKGASAVAKLGKPKFPDRRSKNMWLIIFYANDNTESRKVSEKYNTLAGQKNLPYRLGAVDCRMSSREENFCSEKGIDIATLPKFGFVVDGELITYNDYESQRSSTKDFHSFCMSNMPKQYINNINNLPQLDERLLLSSSSSFIKKSSSMPAVLLLTNKFETSSMFYSIAYYFRNDFTFGESRGKNLKLSQTFAVKKYPTLVSFVPLSMSGVIISNTNIVEKYNDTYGVVRYIGSLKKDAIISWLEKIKTDLVKARKKIKNNRNRNRNRNSRGKTEL